MIDANQDMICFSATFLASEEDVWSIDWNSHCLLLPLELELTLLQEKSIMNLKYTRGK